MIQKPVIPPARGTPGRRDKVQSLGAAPGSGAAGVAGRLLGSPWTVEALRGGAGTVYALCADIVDIFCPRTT